MMSTYYDQVYAVVRCIPKGKVTSYGRIARMLLKPSGARAVGYALRALRFRRDDPNFVDVPWFRVVNHEGLIRVSTVGEEKPLQVEMLESEGVSFLRSGTSFRVDMSTCLWQGLSGREVDAILDEWDEPI